MPLVLLEPSAFSLSFGKVPISIVKGNRFTAKVKFGDYLSHHSLFRDRKGVVGESVFNHRNRFQHDEVGGCPNVRSGMKVSFNQRIADFWRYWDKHPGIALACSIAWILFIGGVAFLWCLGSVGLVDETEPLFAEAARQMTVTGDWITPYFNGETRFDKPPLIYWLMAIAYRLVGVNEWGARLPSALSAIALVGMGFYVLKRFGFSSTTSGSTSTQTWFSAFIGSAVIALNPLMLIWGRTGVSDMLLCGCIGLALLTFFCGYVERDQDSGLRRQAAEDGEMDVNRRSAETQR